MTAVSPCAHPDCRDDDGNRRLTTQNMCDPCRGRLHRELDWIVKDFVTLKTYLPTPVQSYLAGNGRAREGGQQSFGHPSADASDACLEIAWLLNRIEAGLRAYLGDRSAPDLVTTAGLFEVGHGVDRQTGFSLAAGRLLVNHAHTYLSGHFDQLCEWPEVGHHVGAIADTHRTNRAKYGLTRQVEPRLPLPCPSCDVAALVRDGEMVRCEREECGRVITWDYYLSHARHRSAYELSQYEAEEAEEAAGAM